MEQLPGGAPASRHQAVVDAMEEFARLSAVVFELAENGLRVLKTYWRWGIG